MIRFFVEDIEFKVPFPQKIRQWLKAVATTEGYELNEINYIFCSDEYLYQINVEYLDHHTYTDIITFDNSEAEKELIGDIYVSVERVTENAAALGGLFFDEFSRVLVHGILHLCGYYDESDEEELQMRKLEDHYLTLRK
ncbi:MAG: rRNA maturation RNase YbeY [Siphonobacter sp.]